LFGGHAPAGAWLTTTPPITPHARPDVARLMAMPIRVPPPTPLFDVTRTFAAWRSALNEPSRAATAPQSAARLLFAS